MLVSYVYDYLVKLCIQMIVYIFEGFPLDMRVLVIGAEYFCRPISLKFIKQLNFYGVGYGKYIMNSQTIRSVINEAVKIKQQTREL